MFDRCLPAAVLGPVPPERVAGVGLVFGGKRSLRAARRIGFVLDFAVPDAA
jgi:hypothetical protein